MAIRTRAMETSAPARLSSSTSGVRRWFPGSTVNVRVEHAPREAITPTVGQSWPSGDRRDSGRPAEA
jgi:hypothetical protein